MSESQNPASSPAPGQPPAKRTFHAKPKWYIDLLETCRALAGLPVLVSLFLEALTPNTRIIGVGAVIASIIALALHFFPKLRHMVRPRSGLAFWTAFPWILTAVLAAVLVFVIIPGRAVQQDRLLANSWLLWQRNLEEAAGKCPELRPKNRDKETDKEKEKDKENEKTRDQCLAEKVGPVIQERPRPMRESDTTGMASDLMAGQLLLANANTRSVLGGRLSVSDKFLGSGFSVPLGQTDPTAARVPEYFVPNRRDQVDHLWVWQLDHDMILNDKPIAESNLLEVLHTIPPVNQPNFQKDHWEWLAKHLQPTDRQPVLVRFALLDPRNDSGCLGRSDATRVFMSDLRELEAKTVHDAAQSTGYNVPKKSDEPGLKIFIWVYVPAEESQVVKATWGNVLANFETWIKDDACQAPGKGP
jgi:hypothetical protein